MAATGNDPGAPAVGCGAHTATGVPDDARGHLYLYVGGSSGTCTGMDVVRISLTNPSDAVFLRRANANRQCHDNNVIMGTLNLAMCAGGNGFSVFKFDPALPRPARRARRHREPDAGALGPGAGDRRRSGALRLVLLRRQGPDLRLGAGRRHESALPGQPVDLTERQPAVLLRPGDRQPARDHDAHPAAERDRELHVAQLQRRADVQGLLRGLRQLPEGHLGHRLHQPGGRDRGRVRRSEAVQHELPADRRRLVDALLQRQDLPVRHPARPDHLGSRPRPDAARPHAGSVEPADADGVVRAGSRGPGDLDRAAARGGPVQAGPAAHRRLQLHRQRLGRRVVRRHRGRRRGDRHEQDRLPDVHGDGEGQGRHGDDEVGHVRGQQHRRRARLRAGTCRRRWR